jgi:hypothetical protein
MAGKPVGGSYQLRRISEGVCWAVEKDRCRLEELGLRVVPIDYPAELVFTERQMDVIYEAARRKGQPTELLHRPNYLVFSRSLRLIFFWEVKYRDWDPDSPLDDGYFIVPKSQHRMLEFWREYFGVPLYLSVYFRGEWLGYADFFDLPILEERYSKRHNETFVLLPVYALSQDLNRLMPVRTQQEKQPPPAKGGTPLALFM